MFSTEAGTTRDAVTSRLHWGDLRIELVDTAGIEQLDPASPRGMAQRALMQRLDDADLVLLCIDLSEPPPAWWRTEQLNRLGSYCPVIAVGTKQDRVERSSASDMDVAVTVHDRSSLEPLVALIAARLAASQNEMHSAALHRTSVRCRNGIERALTAIDHAVDAVQGDLGEELVAAELRLALDDLASVIGDIHSDDILGHIFSRFCIGK